METVIPQMSPPPVRRTAFPETLSPCLPAPGVTLHHHGNSVVPQQYPLYPQQYPLYPQQYEVTSARLDRLTTTIKPLM